MKRGIFVTFEGGEGSGKSTQQAALSKALSSVGINHITTREPGGTAQGEAIRSLLLKDTAKDLGFVSELFLIAAARREHLEKVIWPALAENTWVLCDRFLDSTMAYQGYAQDLGPEMIHRVNALVMENFLPDITFVMMTSPIVSRQRLLSNREKMDRYDLMDILFFERVHKGFEHILKDNPERCIPIDGLQEPHTITQQLLKILKERKYLSDVN
jgi:dTMP kinase